MIKYGFITLLMAFSLLQAQNFYLVDKDGRKIGPISAKAGEKIEINGKTFTYEPADSVKMTRKMKAIKISKFILEDADLTDVIRFLIEKAIRADYLNKEGVNMVYFPKTVYDMKKGLTVEKKTPSITMEARNLSLYELVNMVAKLAKLKVYIGDHGVELHQL